MRQEIVDWVSALRSGNYGQTTDYLCYDGSYCCLGVLCEVLKMPKIVIGDRGYYEDNMYWLPPNVQTKLGLSRYGNYQPNLLGAKGKRLHDSLWPRCMGSDISLATLNDKGYNFEIIANMIEEIETSNAWCPEF